MQIHRTIVYSFYLHSMGVGTLCPLISGVVCKMIYQTPNKKQSMATCFRSSKCDHSAVIMYRQAEVGTRRTLSRKLNFSTIIICQCLYYFFFLGTNTFFSNFEKLYVYFLVSERRVREIL